ncbi:MAG: proline dehydrogenase family protein [Planctomycetota bacterium]
MPFEIPAFLVRWFARPYVAGSSLEAGLLVAERLLESGVRTTLDLLAEGVRTEARVQENIRVYEQMIDGVAARFADAETRPTISLKPSSYTLDPLDAREGATANGSREAIAHLAEHAHERGVALTLDMEDRRWTDFTIDLANEMFARGYDFGTVLQARLHRTEHDLARIPPGMRVRMVIGIYREPAELALTEKPAMKQRLLAQAAALLQRGVHVELATHDEQCIERFLREVVPQSGVGCDRFEIQMLYGVPRARLIERILDGKLFRDGGRAPVVRLYVPFATSWDQATAYCRRRLKANPSIGVYVARNLLGSLVGKPPGSMPRKRDQRALSGVT